MGQQLRVNDYEDGGDTYLCLPTLRDPNSDWKWQKHSQCARTTLDFFNLESSTNRTKCKLVCAMCPVREECLTFALANNLVDGIWGGMTYKERKESSLTHA